MYKIYDSIYKFESSLYLEEDSRLLIQGKYHILLSLSRNSSDSNCPLCNKRDMVKPILYGLLMKPPDNNKFHEGGCIVRKSKWYCEREKIEF